MLTVSMVMGHMVANDVSLLFVILTEHVNRKTNTTVLTKIAIISPSDDYLEST